MKFSQPIWMIPIGNLLGLSSIVLGLGLVIAGIVSPVWFLLWAGMHAWTSLMVTVGLHRYFSHRSFETNRFWHEAMNWYSAMVLLGSPLAWGAAHITHHVHSDTDRDTHYTGWDYMFWKRYNHVPMILGRLKRLLADKSVVFVHRYGMVIWVVEVLSIGLLSWKVLLFGYLMSLGSVHFIGSLHQLLSHRNKEPRDLAFLEYLLPAFGEWIHKTHHENSGWKDLRTKPWHLDLGYQFIRLIETKKSAE